MKRLQSMNKCCRGNRLRMKKRLTASRHSMHTIILRAISMLTRFRFQAALPNFVDVRGRYEAAIQDMQKTVEVIFFLMLQSYCSS